MPNKPKVVDDWKKVFKTYSFWFYVLASLLALVEQIIPFFGLLQPTMSVTTFAVCMFTLNVLGVVSRFIKQEKLDKEGVKDAQ